MSDVRKPKYDAEFKLTFEKEKMVEFKVRLHYDGIHMRKFFRMMMDGYLKQDSDLLNYLTKAKKSYRIHNISRRQKSQRLSELGKQVEKDFGWSEQEIEEIYDILENDPELCWYDDEDEGDN